MIISVIRKEKVKQNNNNSEAASAAFDGVWGTGKAHKTAILATKQK